MYIAVTSMTVIFICGF